MLQQCSVVANTEQTTNTETSLFVIEGENTLDPSNPEAPAPYELQTDEPAEAVWFSPDSTKILILTKASVGSPTDSLQSRASSDTPMSEGAGIGTGTSKHRWCVYNFLTKEMRQFDVFCSTAYFMQTYVPFFAQYSRSFNPWAPDSNSFIYVTSAGLVHQPLSLTQPQNLNSSSIISADAGTDTAAATATSTSIYGIPSLGGDQWTAQDVDFASWSRM
jgi:hypothetical protein